MSKQDHVEQLCRTACQAQKVLQDRARGASGGFDCDAEGGGTEIIDAMAQHMLSVGLAKHPGYKCLADSLNDEYVHKEATYGA